MVMVYGSVFCFFVFVFESLYLEIWIDVFIKEVTRYLGIASKTGAGGVGRDIDETSLTWVDKCWAGEWVHNGIWVYYMSFPTFVYIWNF